MRAQLTAAVRMLALATIVLGLVYPLAMTAVGHAIFPRQAEGSFVRHHGRVVGSKLLGQPFTGLRYFHPRPSAAGKGGYEGAASAGSNLGPTNERFLRSVALRAAAYRAENGVPADVPVPVDAVTASASGLDPDISIANARLQAPRVARARGLPLATVLRLVNDVSEGRTMGVLGQPGVNVLELNLALDDLAEGR